MKRIFLTMACLLLLALSIEPVRASVPGIGKKPKDIFDEPEEKVNDFVAFAESLKAKLTAGLDPAKDKYRYDRLEAILDCMKKAAQTGRLRVLCKNVGLTPNPRKVTGPPSGAGARSAGPCRKRTCVSLHKYVICHTDVWSAAVLINEGAHMTQRPNNPGSDKKGASGWISGDWCSRGRALFMGEYNEVQSDFWSLIAIKALGSSLPGPAAGAPGLGPDDTPTTKYLRIMCKAEGRLAAAIDWLEATIAALAGAQSPDQTKLAKMAAVLEFGKGLLKRSKKLKAIVKARCQ